MKQVKGAENVRLNELLRGIDAPVDMAFGRQVHDRIGRERLNRMGYRRTIDQIKLLKTIPRMAGTVRQRRQVPCIGKLVEIQNPVALLKQMPNEIGPNESCSPCNNDPLFHCTYLIVSLIDSFFPYGAISGRFASPPRNGSISKKKGSQTKIFVRSLSLLSEKIENLLDRQVEISG